MDDRPLTARTRLEDWVRVNVPHLAGPVLEIGSARGGRSWVPLPCVPGSPVLEPVRVVAVEDLGGVPDRAFGSVVCAEVLEELGQPERALAELRRVTKIGGALLLSVPWLYPFHPSPLDLRRHTLPGVVRLVEDAGWKVREARGLPIAPEALGHLLAAVRIVTGGRCPAPESLGWSNWVVRAAA